MGALNFGVLDALDIIIAAFLLYQIYRLLKGTAAIRILLGMVAIYLLYRLVQLLEMRLLSEFLGSFMGCLLYTSPSPRDLSTSRMPSSA